LALGLAGGVGSWDRGVEGSVIRFATGSDDGDARFSSVVAAAECLRLVALPSPPPPPCAAECAMAAAAASVEMGSMRRRSCVPLWSRPFGVTALAESNEGDLWADTEEEEKGSGNEPAGTVFNWIVERGDDLTLAPPRLSPPGRVAGRMPAEPPPAGCLCWLVEGMATVEARMIPAERPGGGDNGFAANAAANELGADSSAVRCGARDVAAVRFTVLHAASACGTWCSAAGLGRDCSASSAACASAFRPSVSPPRWALDE
jgi:hypothetical protein